MKWMHKLIIPQICSQWIKVAYFLEYPIEKKNEIEESQRSDPYKCCEKLMEDWLASDRGVAPKTWYKLILVLKEIPDLSNATRFIEHSLLKEKLLFKDGKNYPTGYIAANNTISVYSPAWFLEIAFVHEIGVCVCARCARACVCVLRTRVRVCACVHACMCVHECMHACV